jgi:hypothetical protein
LVKELRLLVNTIQYLTSDVGDVVGIAIISERRNVLLVGILDLESGNLTGNGRILTGVEKNDII